MKTRPLECKEVFAKLSDYIDGDLDPELCRCLDEHMQDCEPCVAFIQTLRQTVQLCNELPQENAPQLSAEDKTQLRNLLSDWLKNDSR